MLGDDDKNGVDVDFSDGACDGRMDGIIVGEIGDIDGFDRGDRDGLHIGLLVGSPEG